MAEETTTVDMALLNQQSGDNLLAAEVEFKANLERVQDVIDDISWLQMRRDTLIGEIGTITFDNYDSVFDLVKDINFDTLRQRDLVETDIDKSKKHVFISPSLDAAEAAVIEITKGGGGDFKQTSGVMLSDAVRKTLIAGERQSDARDHNDILLLLEKYISSDQTGNLAWIEEQYISKLSDRDRNVFTMLFTMAQANVEWAFKKGIDIEKLHESFTTRYNRLYLDITQANIAAYKAEVRGNIATLEGQLKELDAKMKVEEMQFAAESTEWELKVDQANSRMQAYVQEYAGKMSRNLKMVSTRMVGGRNIAEGYKTILSAYSSRFSGVSLSNSSE